MLPFGARQAAFRRFPIVTFWIVALCIAVFILQVVVDETHWQWLMKDFHRGPLQIGMLTAIFMHGGFAHLFFNMFWFVGGCGPYLEDVWGRDVFAALFVGGGLAASPLTHGDAHGAFHYGLGASGAIAACMGAFAVRFWLRPMRFLGSLCGLPIEVELPGLAFPLFWGATEVLAWQSGWIDGIGHGAHAMGFLLGAGFGLLMWHGGLEERFIVPRLARRLSNGQPSRPLAVRDLAKVRTTSGGFSAGAGLGLHELPKVIKARLLGIERDQFQVRVDENEPITVAIARVERVVVARYGIEAESSRAVLDVLVGPMRPWRKRVALRLRSETNPDASRDELWAKLAYRIAKQADALVLPEVPNWPHPPLKMYAGETAFELVCHAPGATGMSIEKLAVDRRQLRLTDPQAASASELNALALLCPRCRAPLVAAVVGGVELDRCTDCGGTWYDVGELEQRVDALLADAAPVAGGKKPSVPTSADTSPELLCPHCDHPMRRRNHRGDSTVEVDLCKDHGVFLDRGELGRIVQAEARRSASAARRRS